MCGLYVQDILPATLNSWHSISRLTLKAGIFKAMLVRNRPLKSDALAQSQVDVTTCNSRREYSSILSSGPIYPWEAVKNVPFHLFWSMHQVSVHVSPKCYPKCSAVKRPRYYICLFYAPLLSCISCWEPLFFQCMWAESQSAAEMILQSDRKS